MSLIQCDNCGCVDNTSYCHGGYRSRFQNENYDWSYAPERKGMTLCCACGPSKFKSGMLMNHYGRFFMGAWHNQFKREFLPKGMFFTNDVGNLEHKETGEQDYRPYVLEKEEGT